ncbi:hypothetical protein [Euzebya sp.]|uniref:hypothetical protein n=1 Tax=Euzebya sp. TaxID=1971409 RepID=UPI003516F4DE
MPDRPRGRRRDATPGTTPASAAVFPFPDQPGSTPPRGSGVRPAPDVEADPDLLLRIPVDTPDWAEGLPPVPDGCRVTAVFSHADVAAEHGDALALLGYELVGVLGVADTPTVDLLISRAACDRWPLWRDQLLASGGRVWDLGFGPVAAMLGPAVAVHHRTLAG